MRLKPFGGAIHARAATVRWDLVRWLSLGSVPGALAGVTLLHAVGAGADELVKIMLGFTLLAAASRCGVVSVAGPQPGARSCGPTDPGAAHPPYVALGLIGGTVVGLTSVGSGRS